MSAGTGILHSEKNDSWRLGETFGSYSGKHGYPVRFVQMWVVPDEQGIAPGYEQLEIDGELLSGGLVPVRSGMANPADNAAIRIKNKRASMHAARLQPGQAPVVIPDAPFVHVFVAEGEAMLECFYLFRNPMNGADPALQRLPTVEHPPSDGVHEGTEKPHDRRTRQGQANLVQGWWPVFCG